MNPLGVVTGAIPGLPDIGAAVVSSAVASVGGLVNQGVTWAMDQLGGVPVVGPVLQAGLSYGTGGLVGPGGLIAGQGSGSSGAAGSSQGRGSGMDLVGWGLLAGLGVLMVRSR